jgi:hypothetical protein
MGRVHPQNAKVPMLGKDAHVFPRKESEEKRAVQTLAQREAQHAVQN